MLDLQQTDQGVFLPVQAQPRARRAAIIGVHAGRLKVAVTEPPEKAKANEAIAIVLAESLRLKPAQVRLLRGASSTKKVFVVTEITAVLLQQRIANALR